MEVVNPILELADRVEGDADTLRQYGQGDVANALGAVADEIRDAFDALLDLRLDTRQAAALRGVTVDTMRRLIREGRVDPVDPDAHAKHVRMRDLLDLPPEITGERDEQGDRVTSIASEIMADRVAAQ